MPEAPDDTLAEVQRLYDRGLFLQAHAYGVTHLAALEHWPGPRGGVLAGRVASRLGASGAGDRLLLRTHRRWPHSLGACAVRGRCLWGWRGPFLAWEWLSSVADDPAQPADERVDLLTEQADLLRALHDFTQAEAILAQAEALGERRHWVAVSRARLFEQADRTDDAEAEFRRALTLVPWHRLAVQGLARLLHQREQDEEALALLHETLRHSESADIAGQLAGTLLELRRYDEAVAILDRYEALTPLADRETRRWLVARRADLAYESGRLAEGARLSRLSDHPFHLRVVEAQEQAPPDARRLLIELPFVRQHHLTCAPATLAMLARHWGVDADHLAVADAICYDGTPDHKERGWAEDAGFIVREFTVTWEVAVALIDRGVPFTLTTVEATSAHLQALVGYDGRRRTFLIRDPGSRFHTESIAEPFLADYAPFGPRGMLLVPRAEAARLDGIVLPEVAERDLLHALRRALDRHDRDAASRALDELERLAPAGRVTCMARRNLALYDGDRARIAAASAAWAALFRDHQVLELMHLDDLPETAHAEREQRLEAAVARPGSLAVFAVRLAGRWWWDQRRQGRAEELLRRALRRRGSDATAISLLADIRWDRRERETAIGWYRLCACLEITDEDHAQAYFRASRHLRRTDEALDFLRQRAERAARRSPHPTRTLFWALDQLDRTEEGFQAIEGTLQRHGEDGYLLRFLAREHARYGRYQDADRLLARAEGRVRRIDLLATAAELAGWRGERATAIAHWQEVLSLDPLWMDAHRAIARLREECDGRGAALAHVRAAAARFPHHRGLQVLLVQWLRDDGPAAVEPAIRHLVSVHPHDAWAQRELAWCLLRQGRLDEAGAALDEAQQVDGQCATNENLRGDLRLALGDVTGAQAAWCAAVRLDADDTYAIDRLMDTAGDAATRADLLRLVQAELERQVTYGDGIETFRAQAHGVLPAEAVLGTLQAAHAARPDLWQVWSSLITHLVALDRLDDAEQLAARMGARFPLLPRSWLEQARVAGAQGRQAAELAALTQALQISPGWSYAARRMIELHLMRGEVDAARPVAERIIHHDPLDPLNHVALGRVHVMAQDLGRAVQAFERAATIDPGCDPAWSSLADHDHRRAVNLARAQSGERPHDVRVWQRLADVLTGDDTTAERLAALDRALGIEPRSIDALMLKADTLGQAGRLDEALGCCAGAVWGGHPPSVLRRHAAILEARHGRREAALTRLRALVQEEPQDGDHWCQLSGIAYEAGDYQESAAAAERFCALQPRRPSAWGYLADARLASKDRAGAKAAFQRAVALDPAYAFAAGHLFDLYLADRELEPARQVLDHLLRHNPGEWTTVREVEWHAGQGDTTAALTALERLLVIQDHRWDAVDRAITACTPLPSPPLVALLDRCIASWHAGRRTYHHWARRWVPTQSPRSCAERIDALPEGRQRTRARFAYVMWLGEHAPLDQVRACLARDRDHLRANDECWGAVVYALSNRGAHREAVAWADDWQKRANLEGWVLINLAESCRATNRWPTAVTVHRRAEALAHDHTWRFHALWLAVEAALAGDAANADRYLAEADPDNDHERAAIEVARLARAHLDPAASCWRTASALARLVKQRQASFAAHVELRQLITRLTTAMTRGSSWSMRTWWHLWGWSTRWYASGWKVW